MKNHIGLIIFGVFIVVLIVVAIVFSPEKINEEDYIKEVSMSQVTKMIDKEKTFILYIKQTDCTHCKEFNPVFLSVLSKYDLTAYALNIADLSDEDEEVYEDTFEVDGTPTVLFFDEGNESMIRIEGTQTKSAIENKLKTAGFIE